MPFDGDTVVALTRFQAPLSQLAARAASVDIRDYEIADPERVATELQPLVLTLLGQCRELLNTIIKLAEPPLSDVFSADEGPTAIRESLLPFERAIDAKVARQIGSLREVEEMAFVAQLEIREREDRLKHTRANRASVAVMSECDSSLRRIGKALGAVDATIAIAAGVEPRIVFTSELSTSLAVRRAYAKFRSRIQKQGDPNTEQLRAHMRALGTEIAIFVGSDVYRDLRVQDRLLLRDLQQRLLTWLRSGEHAESQPGVQIWQDFITCVEMFSLVNRRQELVEHDSRVVSELFESRDTLARQGVVREPILAELRKLEGLDPELDALLRGEDPISTRLCSAVLTRLAERLGISEARSRPGVVP